MREDLRHCLKASTEPLTTIKREEDDNHTRNWRPVSLTQTPKINCELVINIWQTDGPHKQIYFCKEPTKTNWSDLTLFYNIAYLLEKGSTYILYSLGGRGNVQGVRANEPEAHYFAMLCVSSQEKTLSWESLSISSHSKSSKINAMKLTDPKCCCRGSKKEMFPHTVSPINILFETQQAEPKYTTLLSQSQGASPHSSLLCWLLGGGRSHPTGIAKRTTEYPASTEEVVPNRHSRALLSEPSASYC